MMIKKGLLIICVLFLATAIKAQVLVEVFTNTNCGNCPDVDHAIEKYASDNASTNVILIYYHNDAPFPGDPFYNANVSDVNYRFYTYYAQSGNPFGTVDGIVPQGRMDYFSTWKPLLDEAKTTSLPATIAITPTVNASGQLDVQLHITGSNSSPVKPYVAVLENNLMYSGPGIDANYSEEKANGWNRVFRAMLPAKDGGESFTLSGSKDLHYTIDTTGKGWNMNNIRIVAFLQDPTAGTDGVSRLVYGAAEAPMQVSAVGNEKDHTTSLGDISPNPATISAAIPFTLAASGIVEFTVSDALGRTISTIGNTRFSKGSNVAYYTPETHTPGIYVVTMRVDGNVIASKKLIVE